MHTKNIAVSIIKIGICLIYLKLKKVFHNSQIDEIRKSEYYNQPNTAH